MREDVRAFIRKLETAGLGVESTPGHYRVLRDGKPLRTIRWRCAVLVELRKLGIDL
jgi:hypothetical protein